MFHRIDRLGSPPAAMTFAAEGLSKGFAHSCGAIYLVAKTGAMQAPGGGETQLLATAEALAELGLNVRVERPELHTLRPGDWVHFFGSCQEFVPLALEARRRGARIAVSTIAWFSWEAVAGESGPLWLRGTRAAKFSLRAAAPRLPSWRKRLYQLAHVLLPNSAAEAEQLQRYFLIPAEKIAVVPNAAAARFAAATPSAFVQAYGLRDFVLFAGRIEPRKNQLGFLQAMRGTGVPVVIVGDAVPGQEPYLDACQAAADGKVTFLSRLDHEGELLASAYAAARCLALTSWFETPGLAALEAGLSGTPLVVTDRGCTREYFGDWARYVSPSDRVAIRREVLAAYYEERSAGRASHISRHFSWQAAALATASAYARLPHSAFAEKVVACSHSREAGA